MAVKSKSSYKTSVYEAVVYGLHCSMKCWIRHGDI